MGYGKTPVVPAPKPGKGTKKKERK